MQVLELRECSAWLEKNSIPDRPDVRMREGESVVLFCRWDRVKASRQSTPIEGIVESATPFDAALLVFDNCALSQPGQITIIQSIRRAFGDTRSLSDAPGQLFARGEEDILGAMCTLLMCFGWSFYVYFDHDPTLHFSEGELMGVFCCHADQLDKIKETYGGWMADTEESFAVERLARHLESVRMREQILPALDNYENDKEFVKQIFGIADPRVFHPPV